MAIPNAINLVGSNTLTQLNPLPTPAVPVGVERQNVADMGKAIPSAMTYEQLVENRKKELNNAVKTVAGYVQNIARELNFSVDESLGKTIVTVLDQATGDVIRQIPTEDMLELSRNLSEIRERSAKGLLFKGDA
jgi:flagellar protein FlaG